MAEMDGMASASPGNGPFAGVVSSELCWSSHGNELRVHSTSNLASHAGHDPNGVPERVTFRFFSEASAASNVVVSTSRSTRSKARGGFVQGTQARRASSSRSPVVQPPADTSACPRADVRPDGESSFRGRTAMRPSSGAQRGSRPSSLPSRTAAGAPAQGACAYQRGSLSPRYHSCSPPGNVEGFFRPDTASGGQAKELLVRDVSAACMQDGRTLLVCLVSERGLDSEIHCVDPSAGTVLHVATALPMMLTKLTILPRKPRDHPLPPDDQRSAPDGASMEDGNATASRGDCPECYEEIVAAVGGVGGRVRLVAMQIPLRAKGHSHPYNSGVREPAQWPRDATNVPAEREGIAISTLAAFSVGAGHRDSIVVAAGWLDGAWSVARAFSPPGGIRADGPELKEIDTSSGAFSSSGNVVMGNTIGHGPALHIVHQETAPGMQAHSPAGFRLWVSTAVALLCYEASLPAVGDSSSPAQEVHPLVTELRPLIPGARPQCFEAMAVGGGPPLPLVTFASIRPSDSSPVLVVLDASSQSSKACLGTTIREVELSTRCCSKSVVSASPHGVWTSACEVKAFVRPGRRGSAEGRESLAATVSLKMHIAMVEASLSEAGRARLRAWEHVHTGAAHIVGNRLEELGLLALSPPPEAEGDQHATQRVQDVALSALEHLVGGEPRLWGLSRRILKCAHRSPRADAHPSGQGRDDVTSVERFGGSGDGFGSSLEVASKPASATMFPALLQGLVALGRAPAIARALTSTLPGDDGKWVLPQARPVQDWAISVALDVWEEAREFMLRASTSRREGVLALGALQRRSRQIQSILDASIERCEQYHAAAHEATTAGGLRRGRRFAMAQQVAITRTAETAPLRRRLSRASSAARLALSVSTAGLYVEESRHALASACLEDTRRESTQEAVVSAQGDEQGTRGFACAGARPALPMSRRLRESAGLESFSGRTDKGSAQGTCDAPASVGDDDASTSDLLAVTRLVGGVFAVDDDIGEDSETAADAARRAEQLLERGLAVVAYSVMSTGYASGRPGHDACSGRQGRQADEALGEKRLLERARSSFDGFCDQVQLSLGRRSQAYLSWLLDNSTAKQEALAAAAAALLNPRAAAALHADPELLALAAAAFAEGFGGGQGLEHGVFMALADELSSAASAARKHITGKRPHQRLCTNSPERGRRGSSVDFSSVDRDGSTPQTRQARRAGSGDVHTRRERGRTVWETPRGVGLTPMHTYDDAAAAAAGDREAPSSLETRPARDRAQAHGHPEPAGVAVVSTGTEGSQTPSNAGGRPGATPSASRGRQLGELNAPREGNESHVLGRRRGQTIWETPRGVGLTPVSTRGSSSTFAVPAALHTDSEPGPAEVSDTRGGGRVRGQTMWETPRGVGLTPRPPAADSISDESPTTSDKLWPHESTRAADLPQRARGRTLWETPRGVGLTPRSGAAPHDRARVDRDSNTIVTGAGDGKRLRYLSPPGDTVGGRRGSPGVWSGSESSASKPVHREVRSFAEGRGSGDR